MVIDIKMCRFHNVPWGFALVGGSDFEYPLQVVKVTEGSIADEAGLRIGDIIVRINDTPATPLTHEQSNLIISNCGNVFFLGVHRDNEEDFERNSFPIAAIEYRPESPRSFLEVSPKRMDSPLLSTPPIIVEPPLEEKFGVLIRGSQEYLPELAERPSSVTSFGKECKLQEQEIAAVLSGESEVLKEHQVMGIFPKPGVCMSSDVLRTLNEEATKTKAEKEKENRRWTTFLQRPDRPIPKSKAQLEAERRAANAYKVQIVRSAPRSQSRSVSPAPPPKVAVPVKEPSPPSPIQEEPQAEPEPEPELPTPADTEVPNLEETCGNATENTAAAVEYNEQEQYDEEDAETQQRLEQQELMQQLQIIENDEIKVEKTEEELALERQLADVQRQLVALSNLPSTIQSTLDAVTKQLADILPTFKLQQQTEEAVRATNLEKIDEAEAGEYENARVAGDYDENDENKDIRQSDKLELEDANNHNDNHDYDAADGAENGASEQIANDTNEARDTIDKNPIKHDEILQSQSMDGTEQKMKKQKPSDVIEELEEHLERKTNPKRSKRAFGPLTPASDRPLVLPGGRRWYRPKDAYNDEFIAETLSAQAELITGSTLGCPYESPHLGYDPRVNFMKYQKPEKKIDLNRSEVYKIIHHLDRQPVRGIEVRPSMVPAEADIRKTVHS